MTPEKLKEKAFQVKAEAFNKDFDEIQRKHKVKVVPVLEYHPLGMKPMLILQELEEKKDNISPHKTV